MADQKKREVRLRHVTPPSFSAPSAPVTQAIVKIVKQVPTAEQVRAERQPQKAAEAAPVSA